MGPRGMLLPQHAPVALSWATLSASGDDTRYVEVRLLHAIVSPHLTSNLGCLVRDRDAQCLYPPVLSFSGQGTACLTIWRENYCSGRT